LDEYLLVRLWSTPVIDWKEAAPMPSTVPPESSEERSVASVEAVCECPDGCRIDHEND
jgi:hypothetical protein